MKTPNKYRVKNGYLGSDDSFGNNGFFEVPFRSFKFRVIASGGGGWEHVSVSLPFRTPNWEEMCFIKDLFWDDTETIVQYHPPKSDYVNNHEHCLHLWKPVDEVLPRPPAILVGIKGVEIKR